MRDELERIRRDLGMTREEFAQLGRDVQLCRVSWPICVDIRREKPDEEVPR